MEIIFSAKKYLWEGLSRDSELIEQNLAIFTKISSLDNQGVLTNYVIRRCYGRLLWRGFGRFFWRIFSEMLNELEYCTLYSSNHYVFT